MKAASIFSLFLVSLNVFAQQVPGAVSQPPTQPPPPAASASAAIDNAELLRLLRAQTAAIKALSNRLDALEQRVEKVEKRNPS